MDDLEDLFRGLLFLCLFLAVLCYTFWIVAFGAWFGFGRVAPILALIAYGSSSILISAKAESMFLWTTTVIGIVWGFIICCVWNADIASTYIAVHSWFS